MKESCESEYDFDFIIIGKVDETKILISSLFGNICIINFDTIRYSNIVKVISNISAMKLLQYLLRFHKNSYNMKLPKMHYDIIINQYQKILELHSIHEYKNKSATKIQKQFRECLTNPKHTICRNRLLREFSDLQI